MQRGLYGIVVKFKNITKYYEKGHSERYEPVFFVFEHCAKETRTNQLQT